MAYELYIFPPEGAPGVPTHAVVKALQEAGIRCKEAPDAYGHWLVLEGHESALNLTINEGIASGAGFRYTTRDDPTVIEKVAGVFKGIGWLVGDDERML
jgi:hypothetical protein